MSLQGVLSELEGLSLDDDNFEDPHQMFLRSFGKRYSTEITCTDDVFKYVDNLRAKKTSSGSKTGAELAFQSIESLLENQMSETRILAEQRNRLVDQLKRMDELCRQSDSVCQTLSDDLSNALQKLKEKASAPVEVRVERVKETTIEETPKIDESYRLLAAVHRVFSVVDGPIQQEIDRIKEDSSKTASERLVEIAQAGSQAIMNAQREVREANEEIEKLKALCDTRSQDCVETLSVLEEEVEFIRKLAFNKDLQNIVLYRQLGTRLSLDDEEREELARRCACVGSFIDEKICRLNSEDMCQKLESYSVKDPIGVFELIKSGDAEVKVRKILVDAEESDDVHVRRVTDILLAQVLMNEILRNYALELSDRVTDIGKLNQRVEAMRCEKDELSKQLDLKAKESQKLRKKILVFKKLLDKILKLTKGEEPCAFIRGMQQELKKVAEMAARQSCCDQEEYEPSMTNVQRTDMSELPSSSRHKSQTMRSVSEELKATCQTLTEENNELKVTVDGLTNKVQDLEKEKTDLDKELLQAKAAAETLKQTLETSTNTFNNTISKLQDDLAASEKRNTALTEEKTALQAEIKKMEASYTKGLEDIRAKCAELRSDMDKKVQLIEKLTNEKQLWTKAISEHSDKAAKLQAELDEMSVANKSLTLKLKAAADNAELEKQSLMSQLAAAQTSVQSQIDKLEKEYTQKASEYNSQILVQIKNIVGESNISDLQQILTKLGSEVSDLRRLQGTYSALIEDISIVQALLHLEPHDKLSERVNSILREYEKLKNSNNRYKQELQQRDRDISTARKEVSRLQGCVAAAKQWDAWAKRILKVIRNCRCSDMNGEQLRLTLEESLLSSVSNRIMFSRLETLKSEKQLLTKFNRRTFTTKATERPTWNSVLGSVIALRRLERLAGGFTVNVNDI